MKQTGDSKGETYYLDTETTGLKREDGATLVELSLLRGDGMVAIDTLINPGVPIPDFITRINGINDEMVREKPTLETALGQLGAVLKPGDLVCIYNAEFDLQWVGDTIRRAGANTHCTMLDYANYKDEYDEQKERMKWHKLGVAAKEIGYTLPSGLTAHRALADCYMTKAVQEHIWESKIAARGKGGLMVTEVEYKIAMDLVRDRMASDRILDATWDKARGPHGGVVDNYYKGHLEAMQLVCSLLNEPNDLELTAMKRHQGRKQKPRRDDQEQGR